MNIKQCALGCGCDRILSTETETLRPCYGYTVSSGNQNLDLLFVFLDRKGAMKFGK